MAKKDLKGGINNLFSGADQRVTQHPIEETESTRQRLSSMEDEGAAQMEQRQIEDSLTIIDTIENQELRDELKMRLHQKRMVGRGRPRKNTDPTGRRIDGYDRTSLIIPVSKWAKIKEIAFRETLTMKEIVELALDMVIERYENKHGEVIPHPEQKKDIHEIF